jgi:NRAMP (natural resistance-associated macrophage protein)-like metal ion transporter
MRKFVRPRDLLKRLGPGFVTGASDDDPAGIGTYVQAGAQFGTQQLWTALFMFPVMALVQEMCGRIGLVTGQGLSAVIRNNYAAPILFFIVGIQVVTNAINIGADLSAMAESAQLLTHAPFFAMLGLVTIGTTVLIVVMPYKAYARYLKVLGLSLLTYVAAAFSIREHWNAALAATFVPHFSFNRDFLMTLVAVFGVTVSPYEFFWQSSEEVEELVDQRRIAAEEAGRPRLRDADIANMRYDTTFGMFFSNVVMWFIMLVAGATLFVHGKTQIQSAAEAAQALRPLAGSLAFLLFSAGIVSAGLLSIPVMAASSAYAVSGAFGWSRSLNKPFWQEWRFYGIIVASMVVGLSVNAFGVPPFRLLYYSGVLNGVISPPLLFIVTHISSRRSIMGRFVNPRLASLLGWSLCAFVTVLVVAFFVL